MIIFRISFLHHHSNLKHDEKTGKIKVEVWSTGCSSNKRLTATWVLNQDSKLDKIIFVFLYTDYIIDNNNIGYRAKKKLLRNNIGYRAKKSYFESASVTPMNRLLNRVSFSFVFETILIIKLLIRHVEHVTQVNSLKSKI